jgi:hypothetical protein
MTKEHTGSMERVVRSAECVTIDKTISQEHTPCQSVSTNPGYR